MSQKSVVLYLHVHQPYRIRPYSVFDTGEKHDYFNETDASTDRHNETVFQRVADKSYRPMNVLLERLLDEQPEFRLSLSITGVFLEQAERWAPDVIASFQRLVATGRVEIVAETYHHSLAYFYSQTDFVRQVEQHKTIIKRIFNVETQVFRNTELAYNNSLAKWAEDYGFKGILSEGWDPILNGQSTGHPYTPAGSQSIKLLMKNYRLSDDIAFRFSDQAWSQWPLAATTFSQWIAESDGPLTNLFMDYETFGEHQWADTGIFGFFEEFVRDWLRSDQQHSFATVSQAVELQSAGQISMPETVTWADNERDLSAWNGNSLQQEALRHLYSIENDIIRSNDHQLIEDWRHLQTSDMVYYMSMKGSYDGQVHAYFSPYDSPYDAFLYYINVIRDLRYRVMQHHQIGGFHG